MRLAKKANQLFFRQITDSDHGAAMIRPALADTYRGKLA
ncbi:hypothetical protein MRBBS_2771 [Marinobacter sp. BSs20148]|nr:hypothetical protein MRBBS_2771 [Marinobacter sp. BSs20148]